MYYLICHVILHYILSHYIVVYETYVHCITRSLFCMDYIYIYIVLYNATLPFNTILRLYISLYCTILFYVYHFILYYMALYCTTAYLIVSLFFVL